MLSISITIPILPRAWLVARTGAGTMGVMVGKWAPLGLQGRVLGPGTGMAGTGTIGQGRRVSKQGKLSLSLVPFPESPAWLGCASTTSQVGDTDPPFPCEYQGPPCHAPPWVGMDPSVPPWHFSPGLLSSSFQEPRAPQGTAFLALCCALIRAGWAALLRFLCTASLATPARPWPHRPHHSHP